MCLACAASWLLAWHNIQARRSRNCSNTVISALTTHPPLQRTKAEHIPLMSHYVLEFARLQGPPKPGRLALVGDRGYQYDKR
jgi:hypothetical protein